MRPYISRAIHRRNFLFIYLIDPVELLEFDKTADVLATPRGGCIEKQRCFFLFPKTIAGYRKLSTRA